MLDSTFSDRLSRLTRLRLDERRQVFPSEMTKLAAEMSARGSLHSGGHIHLSRVAHSRELDVRALIVWESIVRVHKTFGAPLFDNLRQSFKVTLQSHIRAEYEVLNGAFVQTAKRFGVQRDQSDLADSLLRVLETNDLEVDLYVDSLRPTDADQMTSTPVYNFFGSVGSVQTGPHSIANNVKNVSADDLTVLVDAINRVGEAISSGSSMPDRQRAELLSLASEARQELNSADPNNTKLFTIFNVLAGSIQAIPSAQPAYQLLKTALIPLGILLP